MRRIVRWGGALLLAVVLAAGFTIQHVRSGPGLPEGERVLAGLDGPVEILWDSVGIPHVWASTQRDALFAQGYLHAMHRLWQIEMFRRVARGRLSELFGDVTLDTDRFLRTLGMSRAAEAGLEKLDRETRGLLEGYVDGLNAAVAGWEGLLPPEFLILGTRPEPFHLVDVLGLEKIMAWDLSDYESSLSLAEAHGRLGDEEFGRVAPFYPMDGITILESAGLEESVPVASAGTAAWGSVRTAGVPNDPKRALEAGSRIALVQSALRPSQDGYDFVGAVGAVRASNAWVVGPDRSASGMPMVANDMHLALDQPTLWYLMGLHAPGLDVVGMSLPGTAGIVAGRTGGLAWGFTNAMVDDTELYLERLDPDDPERYLTPAGSEPFETRTEVIRIRGGGADTLRVRSTRHGPVITPVERRLGGELLALRWVALDPSTTAEALLDMNRAGDAEAFLAALAGFSDPHQNVVFADTAGTWGYWMAGRIPVRATSRPPLTPVPGWSGDADWQGYLPFEEHPHAVGPPSGFVATANNRQTRQPVGDRISAGVWASPYRAQRISELLAARLDHDVSSLHAIQLDVVSGLARDYRELAVDAFRAVGAEAEADQVAAWDGSGGLDSRGATLFYAWYEAVGRELRRDVYGEPAGYLAYARIHEALDGGLSPERLARTGREALEIGARPWGEVHRLSLDHPLARVPVVGPLFGFGEAGIPRTGTPHTVNVAEYIPTPEGFAVRRGPSQRHVADLADLDAGGFVIPGGQSGYPEGEHSFDQFPLWSEGGLIPVPMTRAGVEARTRSRLVLAPQGGS
ncbi:MAG: penicillin acylase family protein [Gemmatimonadales bacterium]|nr:MAG: penicillin acylase family protein [Gemmatimonadales bacterium]